MCAWRCVRHLWELVHCIQVFPNLLRGNITAVLKVHGQTGMLLTVRESERCCATVPAAIEGWMGGGDAKLAGAPGIVRIALTNPGVAGYLAPGKLYRSNTKATRVGKPMTTYKGPSRGRRQERNDHDRVGGMPGCGCLYSALLLLRTEVSFLYGINWLTRSVDPSPRNAKSDREVDINQQ